MKKAIAIILTIVSVLTCLTVFAGCTAEARLKAKQALCSHKWKQTDFVQGNCQHQYDVTTYTCSRCQKTKKNEKSIVPEHDYQELRIDRAEDCQHQDWLYKECSLCMLQSVDVLDTYGPHVDNDDNGVCDLCSSAVR